MHKSSRNSRPLLRAIFEVILLHDGVDRVNRTHASLIKEQNVMPTISKALTLWPSCYVKYFHLKPYIVLSKTGS